MPATPSEIIEANRNLGRRFFQEQDQLHGGPADNFCAPVYTARLAGYPAMDLSGHKQFAAAWYSAFPDTHHTIEDVMADSNGATVRFTIRGTHKGAFNGVGPTGKSITVGGIAMMRVQAGKVVDLWAQFDQAGMLQQLGLRPGQ